MRRRASLHITGGPNAGRVMALDDAVYIVGRVMPDAAASITLNDPEISRQHIRLTRDDKGGWTICDLFSINGTQINGMLLEGNSPYPLYDGDMILLGNSTLIFRLE